MHGFLQDLIVSHLFAFLLIFMRFGTALMIMPGIGDSFVSPSIRLLYALGLSFVLTPVLGAQLPSIPTQTVLLVGLLLSEAMIGLFIGTLMRIMVSALDTAGTIVSVQAGLSNANIFNPATESQAAVISALYSALGVTLIFATNTDHNMLAAVVNSYQLFPAKDGFPDMGSLSEAISKTTTLAFKVGAQLAFPFLVVGTLMQVGLGLLGRLMPQIQIFFVAMPLQILLSFLIMLVAVSVGVIYWLDGYSTMLGKSMFLE